MQKKKRNIIIIAVIAVVAIGGAVFAITRNKKTVETVMTKVVATKGDISNTISGSGTVEPIEEYTVVTTVTGEILSDNVEIGQEYKKGDLLYVIDSTDAENAIIKAQNNLERQKMSYEQAQESLNNLTITAPFSGRISEMYIEEGDNVGNGTKIAELVDSNILTVILPFLSNDAKNINKGNKANIYLELLGEEVTGTVEKVATGSYANSYGAMISDVEISFQNPGNIKSGELVSAVIGTYACNASAKAVYKNQTTITSETSGTILSLNFSNGDLVKKFDTILTLKNDSTVLTEKSSQTSLKEAEITLAEAQDDLNDCTVKSPIDGVVTYKDYKKGDTITNDNSTTLAVVADMSKLSFSMNIDELDIKNISTGQKVIVTADALTGKEFEGEITNISINGTASSGVTTYPVTVVISEYEGLLPGMNVSAEIVSEEVTDIIKVPTSAVSRGDVVLVTEEYANSLEINKNKEENTDTKKKVSQPGQIVEMPNTPEGYKYIKVKTGLSDANYIEIKEGIDEEAEVVVITTVSNKESEASASTTTTGMFGGGMPAGGMPGNFSGGTYTVTRSGSNTNVRNSSGNSSRNMR